MEVHESQIEELNREVEQRMPPFESATQLIDDIPGIGRQSAEAILAETGIDMTWFPTAQHVASWARVCPGTKESAGVRPPASKPEDLVLWNCCCSLVWASGGDSGLLESIDSRYAPATPERPQEARAFHIHSNDYYKVHLPRLVDGNVSEPADTPGPTSRTARRYIQPKERLFACPGSRCQMPADRFVRDGVLVGARLAVEASAAVIPG